MDKNKLLDNGLSAEEVAIRKAKLQINEQRNDYTKPVIDIFKDNLLTPFNFIIAVIGCSLALVNAYINMLFVFIIVINIAVGIIQELIAKRLVEKLSLLSVDKCSVIRNREEYIIKSNEIVLDDLIIIRANSQIVCDGVIISGEVEVNEALLTGEYEPIVKQENSRVLSGSYVISGKAYVKVEHVGEDNYASKISIEAKKHKKTFSVLMDSMDKLLKLITVILIPAGIIMFLRALFLENGTLYDAVVTSSASILGMVPIGVVLLITASLATGVIKLSRMKVLVQELHALESLSRVDLLCLDKTGTLTQGKMEVSEIEVINSKYQAADFVKIVANFIAVSEENNATFNALKNYFNQGQKTDIHNKISFSSQRKWSSVSFTNNETYYLGAPDILVSEIDLEKYLNEDYRVLLFGKTKGVNYEGELLENIEIIGFIYLSDPIRSDVKETMNYFKEQGVNIKVISGDNPLTVSKIAQKSGINNYDKFLDICDMSDDDLIEKASKYTIFGRANPNQKKTLIKEFKKQYTVAMTGDGINDVLALKEADCSIAIAQGSDAAKHVSQLVLIDSEFNDLPAVVNEGRRVVNNITKVASVYFVKTIYSFLLTIIAILIGVAYPFIPIQITIINFALVAIPTFAITFEKNDEPISGSFIIETLSRAIPNALSIIIMLCIIKLAGFIIVIDLEQQTTMMYYAVAFITFLTTYQISQPLNKFRGALLIVSVIIFVISLYIFKDSVELQFLNLAELITLLIILILGYYSIYPLHDMAKVIVPKVNKKLNKKIIK